MKHNQHKINVIKRRELKKKPQKKRYIYLLITTLLKGESLKHNSHKKVISHPRKRRDLDRRKGFFNKSRLQLLLERNYF